MFFLPLKRVATLGWIGLPNDFTFTKIFIILTLFLFVVNILLNKNTFLLGSPFKNALNIAIIFYLFASFLSILNATEPGAGISILARRLIVIIIYVLIINIVHDEKTLRIAALALIIGNIPNLLGGVYELITQTPIIDNRLLIMPGEYAGKENILLGGGEHIRIQSFLLDSDILAYFTILIMGIVLACLFSPNIISSKFGYLLFGVLFLLHITIATAASSRAGWLGLFGSLLIFVLFIKTKYKKFLIAGFSILVALIFTILSVVTDTPMLKKLFGSGNDYSVSQRWLDSKVGLNTFRSNPILGVGMGNVEVVRHRFFSKAPGLIERKWIPYFSNGYIQILAESGLLGLLGYLSIIVIFIKLMMKVILYSSNIGQRIMALGILSSFMGHLIMLIAYPLHDSELVWTLTGLGIALFNISGKGANVIPKNSTPSSWMKTIAYPRKKSI